MLQDAIKRNQKRQARFKKYEQVLRRLRQRVFDYEDAGKGDKAARLIRKCKVILQPMWQAHADAMEHAHGQRVLNTWA